MLWPARSEDRAEIAPSCLLWVCQSGQPWGAARHMRLSEAFGACKVALTVFHQVPQCSTRHPIHAGAGSACRTKSCCEVRGVKGATAACL